MFKERVTLHTLDTMPLLQGQKSVSAAIIILSYQGSNYNSNL